MTNFLETSLLGMARGTSVQLLIYPLQTIKTRLQNTPPSVPHAEVIRTLFHQKGIAGFYSGLTLKLIDTNIKQIWCWSLIQAIPKRLEEKGLAPIPSHMLTGIAIAAIDSISTPLETAKIRAILSEEKRPFFSLFSNGWKGLGANASRLTVQWTSFLTAQSYFRSQYSQENLSGMQMVAVGIKTACVVSIVAAPFDTINTLTQVANCTLKRTPMQLYRHLPYTLFPMLAQNIASVILIEYLKEK